MNAQRVRAVADTSNPGDVAADVQADLRATKERHALADTNSTWAQPQTTSSRRRDTRWPGSPAKPHDGPGYIPNRAAYPAGGYEVAEAYRAYGRPAPFAPKASEALQAAAHELIGSLMRDSA